MHDAIEAHFQAVNRRGGIAGRYPVRVLFAETNYDPATTAAQVQATKDQVVAYASILGTANVAAVAPTLAAEHLLASPASQDAAWADQPSLLPIGSSYQVQAAAGISYYLAQPGRASDLVCAVSIATPFGDAGAEGVRLAQAAQGFALGPQLQVSPTDDRPLVVLGPLRSAGCKVVMLTIAPQQVGAIVLGARATGWTDVRWIVMGAGFSERLVTQQSSLAFEQSTWVVGDGTQWGDAQAPGMSTLMAELEAGGYRHRNEKPDVGLTFGWAQARALEMVLERAAADGDLSRSGIERALNKVGPIDFGGLASPIDYSRPQRISEPLATVFAVDGSYQNSIRVIAKNVRAPIKATK